MTALNYVTYIILSTNLIQLSSLWSYLKVHSLIFHNSDFGFIISIIIPQM